jgi:hypothetical protein
MRKTFERHAGKILLAVTIGLFVFFWYSDEMSEAARACKAVGGRLMSPGCISMTPILPRP